MGGAARQRESIKIKEEYYSFRDSSGVQFVLFSSVLLAGHTWTNQRLLKGEPSFVPPIKVGLQAFLCWLLYFYVALSMRENVLSTNGSQVCLPNPTLAPWGSLEFGVGWVSVLPRCVHVLPRVMSISCHPPPSGPRGIPRGWRNLCVESPLFQCVDMLSKKSSTWGPYVP